MFSDKKIPGGNWLNIARLPLGTTAEQLSEFFHEHGVRIPPEYIAVRDFAYNAGAYVSVSKEVTADLINWACNGDSLGAIKFHAEPQRPRQ